MPRRRRPYEIREKNRHGKYVWYFRRPGHKRTRLRGDYNSPEYIAAYNAAFAGKLVVQAVGRPSTGTVAWLVDQYKGSAHWKGLRASTQRVRNGILKSFVDKSGAEPFNAIRKHHMQAAMDAKADQPFAADNALKTIRKVFEWAVSVDHIQVNPCDGVKPIRPKTDGFHCWTIGEVEQFRLFHPVGTRARLALDILLFTGLRRSDLVCVGPQHLTDKVITFRTQKTGITVYLTVCPELQKSISTTPTGPQNFIINAYGKPFSTPENFGTWFAKQCGKAGLPEHCRAHGLRKAGATIAANNGASAHELCAMYGWTKLETAQIYTKDADRKRLSKQAGKLIANDRTLLASAVKNQKNLAETIG